LKDARSSFSSRPQSIPNCLGSVLGLRWDDLDFEKREIRWRAELDKRRRTWVTPLPALATNALLAERQKYPAIGAGRVFPSGKNPARPITPHLADYWLKRAFEIAKTKSRPEHFDTASGENGRRNAGIFR